MIIDDILSSLKEDSPVSEVHTCALWTAVVSRQFGLAATLRGDWSEHSIVRGAGKLDEMSARQLSEYARSENLLEAAIGMAAINSLIEIDDTKCTRENAVEILIKEGAGKKVALVGHFPWVPRLREAAGQLWILDQRPIPGDYPPEAAEELLPRADVVGITGTSFTNHTIDHLLELNRKAFKLVIGPTTPMSPVLFDYGIDVISGIKVVDAKSVLRYIGQGAMFKQIRGLDLISMRR